MAWRSWFAICTGRMTISHQYHAASVGFFRRATLCSDDSRDISRYNDRLLVFPPSRHVLGLIETVGSVVR